MNKEGVWEKRFRELSDYLDKKTKKEIVYYVFQMINQSGGFAYDWIAKTVYNKLKTKEMI